LNYVFRQRRKDSNEIYFAPLRETSFRLEFLMATTTKQIEERPRLVLPRAGRGNEILAILFLALGLLLALCLISAAFYPNDPSWNSAGQAQTQN